MSSHAIKVSESTYSLLKKRARKEEKTIKEVVDKMARESDFSDYAGSWEMEEEEKEKIRNSRKKLWQEWEL